MCLNKDTNDAGICYSIAGKTGHAITVWLFVVNNEALVAACSQLTTAITEAAASRHQKRCSANISTGCITE